MAKLNPFAISVNEPSKITPLSQAPFRFLIGTELKEIAKVATNNMLLHGDQSTPQVWSAFFLGGLEYVGFINDKDAVPRKWTIVRVELKAEWFEREASSEEMDAEDVAEQVFVEESTLWDITAARHCAAIYLDVDDQECWLLLPRVTDPLSNGKRVVYVVSPAKEGDSEHPQIPTNIDWDTLIRDLDLVNA